MIKPCRWIKPCGTELLHYSTRRIHLYSYPLLADSSSRTDDPVELVIHFIFARLSIYSKYFIENESNSPVASSQFSSTFLTVAPGGPFLHHFKIFSTLSFSPSKTASTRPSRQFLTQPLKPNELASSLVLALKKTP